MRSLTEKPKKKKVIILEVNYSVYLYNFLIECFKSRFDRAEENISNLEDRIFEIIQSEEQKE